MSTRRYNAAALDAWQARMDEWMRARGYAQYPGLPPEERSETVEGFPNYETWGIALELDNNRGSAERWHRNARAVLAGARAGTYDDRYSGTLADDRERLAVVVLADALKEVIENRKENAELPALWDQLTTAALCRVEWEAIAGHWLNEARIEAAATA